MKTQQRASGVSKRTLQEGQVDAVLEHLRVGTLAVTGAVRAVRGHASGYPRGGGGGPGALRQNLDVRLR